MIKKFTEIVIILNVLLISALHPFTYSSELFQYKTPEELRDAYEEVKKSIGKQELAKIGEKIITFPQDYDKKWFFIVDYLGSEDSALRDTAVDILADFVRFHCWIRPSALEKYLSEDYPMNVRVVAAAHCLVFFHWKYIREMSKAEGQEMMDRFSRKLSKFFNDVVAIDEEIPNLGIINISLRQKPQIPGIFKPENKEAILNKLKTYASIDQYKSPEQLREFCKPFLRPFSGAPIQYPDPDTERVFIVDYLDSDNLSMRDAAVDILIQMAKYHRYIRPSILNKYISDEYSMKLRVGVILHYSAGYGPMGNKDHFILKEEDIEKRKKIWIEFLNELAEDPNIFPDIGLIALNTQSSDIEHIKAKNKPLLAQLFLGGIAGESEPTYRGEILRIVSQFDENIALEEFQKWYSIEKDKSARASFLNNIDIITQQKPEKLAKLKPIIELATKDEDEKIAEKAKEIIKKIK